MQDVVTSPTNLSYRAISQYAQLVGKHHEIYDATGRADINALVSAIDGSVEQVEDIFAPEASTVDETGKLTIWLPPLTSWRRDRFTLAHELGHYFLHYVYSKRNGETRFSRGGRNMAETEANVFAASLLMPEETFKEVFLTAGQDWWEISNHFDVSPSAARVRAEALKLI
jgi:hypothetical protein